MAIKKISLCWVTVSDMEKSKKFFIEQCGLKFSSGAPEHGWMEVVGQEGGMLLGVGQANPEYDAKAGVNAVVTMTVDDIVASKKEMEAKGVQFIGDIMEVPGHVKMVTFVDSDNNTYQLVQELESAHGGGCC